MTAHSRPPPMIQKTTNYTIFRNLSSVFSALYQKKQFHKSYRFLDKVISTFHTNIAIRFIIQDTSRKSLILKTGSQLTPILMLLKLDYFNLPSIWP